MRDVKLNTNNIRLLRVMACLMVLLAHLGGRLLSSKLLLNFVGFAAEAVRIFFVLSGYLCCFSSELKSGKIWKYYKKRIIRILPVYYIVISAWLVYAVVSKARWPEDASGLYWARYYLLLSTFVPSEHPAYWENLGGTWTVGFFIVFYLFAPLLYKYLNSLRKCMIASLVFLAGAAILLPEGYVLPLKGLYAFITGMAIYYAQRERKVEIITAFFVLLGIFFNLCGVAYPYGDTYLLSAIMISVLSMGIVKTGIPTAFIKYLDRHSYTIYLLHPFLMCIIAKTKLGNWNYLYVSVIIILTVVISGILDKIVEYFQKIKIMSSLSRRLGGLVKRE